MRYLRLYLYFLRFSFSKAMEFRLDFYFRVVMDMCYYIVNIVFYKVLFLHTDVFGGWSAEQMMVFVAGFLIVDALSMTIFANNLWILPELINKGDLDYYLIRPVSSLFILSLRDFAANSFVNLLMSFGIFMWALHQYPETFPLYKIGLFVLLLFGGAFIRYCLRMIFIIPTFWLHSGRGLSDAFFTMNRFVERPDRIFTGVVRVILTTILPFSVMVSFPARILLDRFDSVILLHFLFVAMALFCVVLLIWGKALKAYSSASS